MLGPLLVTVTVYVKSSPVATGGVGGDRDGQVGGRDRLAWWRSTELLARLGSLLVLETVAVWSSAPAIRGWTTTSL